eukprot:TRINITY_DN7102_c0_g1_i1.p1 TRINITY_DN7102_c0_g1~~TRINITY_DN7102_c0_g1_i1.p1  ORF type:complete len:357 (-),score=22.85 TRINITY_DN7102_c0_g1_i1:44-1114(-)
MTIAGVVNVLIDHPPAIEWKNLTRPPHRPHNIPWGTIDKHSFCFHVWNNDVVFSRDLPIKLAILPTILIALAWVFVLFLVINLRKSLQTLKRKRSAMRKFYYVLVWIVALVNLARTLMSLLWQNTGSGAQGNQTKDKWPNAEDVAILVLDMFSSCLMWTIETSVVVFLLHGHIQIWRKLLKRVSIITLCLGMIYITAQIITVFVTLDRLSPTSMPGGTFQFEEDLRVYWISVHSVNAGAYLFILLVFVLPFCKKKCFRAPTKKIIYLYLSYLLILHIGGILGPVLSWVLLLDAGYCVSSATNIFYIASFSPLLYYAFLWDFFHTGEDEEGETLHSVPIYYTPLLFYMRFLFSFSYS